MEEVLTEEERVENEESVKEAEEEDARSRQYLTLYTKYLT